MSEMIRKLLLTALCAFTAFSAFANDDDYILGLKSFTDGLFSISSMSLEEYIKTGGDKQKLDYSKYLLYRIYLNSNKFDKAFGYFKEIETADDSRFDKKQMANDKMFMLTKLDCKQAGVLARTVADDMPLDIYLGSSCPVDGAFVKLVLEKAKTDNLKLKAVTRVSDKPELVKSIFTSMDASKLSGAAKRYFAVYFYQHGDFDSFWKVRDVYEDAEVVGLELDRYWNKGDKDTFVGSFEKYRSKYALGKTNTCRAIEIYNESGKSYDCNMVNECMDYSVEFVQIKGACLAKKGEPEKLTEFIDSLGSKIFPGICAYGEYVFSNRLYTGSREIKFYQCDNKFNIADVMVQKRLYQSLVNMFLKPEEDMDRYYAVIGYAGLGRKDDARKTAEKISDNFLKSKLAGTLK